MPLGQSIVNVAFSLVSLWFPRIKQHPSEMSLLPGHIKPSSSQIPILPLPLIIRRVVAKVLIYLGSLQFLHKRIVSERLDFWSLFGGDCAAQAQAQAQTQTDRHTHRHRNKHRNCQAIRAPNQPKKREYRAFSTRKLW